MYRKDFTTEAVNVRLFFRKENNYDIFLFLATKFLLSETYIRGTSHLYLHNPRVYFS